ncbi:MAG: glycosyltransferase family 4 protein [Limisphaerales bacterium]
MNVLLLHGEGEYFAGAERMLGYYLETLPPPEAPQVAVPPGTRLAGMVPTGTPMVAIESNSAFSLPGLLRNLARLRRTHRATPMDVVHGWHARDWELTVLASRLLRRPAVGTLHDDPLSSCIRPRRRWMMRSLARRGLARVICVSEAVAARCREAGYPPHCLQVIHNGLPAAPPEPWPAGDGTFRVGFLGAFSARKGLDRFCEALGHLDRQSAGPWRAVVAGAAQDAAGEALMAGLRARFGGEPWWPKMAWIGWVKDARELLRQVDVLVVPSTEFDPFPTVLLEAARAGRPVVAARVGGAPEIVVDGVTGWLYPPEDAAGAAACLHRLATQPLLAARMGEAAAGHLSAHLTIEKMVAAHRALYSTVVARC